METFTDIQLPHRFPQSRTHAHSHTHTHDCPCVHKCTHAHTLLPTLLLFRLEMLSSLLCLDVWEAPSSHLWQHLASIRYSQTICSSFTWSISVKSFCDCMQFRALDNLQLNTSKACLACLYRSWGFLIQFELRCKQKRECFWAPHCAISGISCWDMFSQLELNC